MGKKSLIKYMPQFDFYSFSSQCAWVLVSFFLFYLFTLRFYLVQYSEVLKMRKKLFTSYNDNSKVGVVNLRDLFLLEFLKNRAN